MAIGRRELLCVNNAVQFPPSPISLYGRGTYIPSRAVKIAALEHYLKLVPYLLPTDPSILASYLWHGDLHSENIFVNPDKPSEILGIIDWQSTQILPLYEVARQPFFLDYEGPPVIGLERPNFPENLDQLKPAERQKAHTLYLHMALSALYRNLVHETNITLYRAMEYRETTSFTMLLLAQNLFVDGEALYRSYVVELQKEWESLLEIQARGIPPYPFQVPSDDLDAINQDAADAIRGMKQMNDLKTELGDLWPEKGLVRHDQYKDVKIALASAKERFIGTMAHLDGDRKIQESLWPFDDLDGRDSRVESETKH